LHRRELFDSLRERQRSSITAIQRFNEIIRQENTNQHNHDFDDRVPDATGADRVPDATGADEDFADIVPDATGADRVPDATGADEDFADIVPDATGADRVPDATGASDETCYGNVGEGDSDPVLLFKLNVEFEPNMQCAQQRQNCTTIVVTSAYKQFVKNGSIPVCPAPVDFLVRYNSSLPLTLDHLGVKLCEDYAKWQFNGVSLVVTNSDIASAVQHFLNNLQCLKLVDRSQTFTFISLQCTKIVAKNTSSQTPSPHVKVSVLHSSYFIYEYLIWLRL
jgi:hypothetical protein